jgi:hypothetical protein
MYTNLIGSHLNKGEWLPDEVARLVQLAEKYKARPLALSLSLSLVL